MGWRADVNKSHQASAGSRWMAGVSREWEPTRIEDVANIVF